MPPLPDPSPEELEAGQARVADAGIVRLPVPTPFPVGRVHCYLIEDDPLTLVDTGPNSGTSLDALERALAEHGRAIEEIELIVLTHQHLDHVGLLEIIARRSGAQVAAFSPLAPWLSAYPGSARDDDEYTAGLMLRHGVPEQVIGPLRALAGILRAYGSRGTVTRPLSHDDVLHLGHRDLRILHRPGHSPSDIVLWDEQRRLLIGGDHLLGKVSSNALFARPLGVTGPFPRPRPLIDYIGSLEATRAMPIDLVLPGHGEYILDHRALIDERLRLQQRRARKIAEMLDTPRTAHEIAVEMWGGVALVQSLLTISEVLGHLDLLIDAGTVAEHDDGAVIRFVRT